MFLAEITTVASLPGLTCTLHAQHRDTTGLCVEILARILTACESWWVLNGLNIKFVLTISLMRHWQPLLPCRHHNQTSLVLLTSFSSKRLVTQYWRGWKHLRLELFGVSAWDFSLDLSAICWRLIAASPIGMSIIQANNIDGAVYLAPYLRLHHVLTTRKVRQVLKRGRKKKPLHTLTHFLHLPLGYRSECWQ